MSVSDTTLNRQRQRIRWWSALALLRSMASSPAAAMATLRTRAVEANTPEEADAQGRQSVLDLVEDDSAEGSDVAPAGADEEPGEQSEAARRLMAMANAAEALHGAKDTKLKRAVAVVEDLLANGFHPILFCRFIPTAEYVAAELRKKLKGVTVEAVTGTLPPKEREDRVNALGACEKRILVCTDSVIAVVEVLPAAGEQVVDEPVEFVGRVEPEGTDFGGVEGQEVAVLPDFQDVLRAVAGVDRGPALGVLLVEQEDRPAVGGHHPRGVVPAGEQEENLVEQRHGPVTPATPRVAREPRPHGRTRTRGLLQRAIGC